MNSLKRLIKRCIYLLVCLFCNKATKVLIRKIKLVGNFIYGNFIKTSLKRLGNSFFIEYPVILKGGEYIEIGNGFSSRSRLRIEAWDSFAGNHYKPNIKIGDNVTMNFDCHIGAINLIEIGNNVLIGSRVLITDHSHGETTTIALSISPSERPLYSKGPVIIGDNVWIGEGVVILPNVRIGKNVIIGANSVVTNDVPDNFIVGGIPARLIKQL